MRPIYIFSRQWRALHAALGASGPGGDASEEEFLTARRKGPVPKLLDSTHTSFSLMHSTLVRRSYKPLSKAKIARLANAKWKIIDDKLFKRFALPSHTAAAEFAVRVARCADDINHHPEIHIKYRFISFSLRSNDANNISEVDERLAHIIDNLKVPKE